MEMAQDNPTGHELNIKPDNKSTSKLVAAGGILGAIAASSCCILPLVLFSLGISGAWISNLTALYPYKPYIITMTIGLLGYGFYLVYAKPKTTCTPDKACARPLPNKLVKAALWLATVLVLATILFPYAAPYLLGDLN